MYIVMINQKQLFKIRQNLNLMDFTKIKCLQFSIRNYRLFSFQVENLLLGMIKYFNISTLSFKTPKKLTVCI